MGFKTGDLAKINHMARLVRKELEAKYGETSEAMMGKCIEGTDKLVQYLKSVGLRAEAKQVWCLYEYFEGCTDYCFEEHWIVIVQKGTDKWFVDVTMDQFQWAFSRQLNKIYIGAYLPNFYLTRKPGKGTLDKCGWNDWYNTGNYVNNFDYYGYNKR